MPRLVNSIFIGLSVFPLLARADDAPAKSYTAIGQSTLRLKIPAGWQDHSKPAPAGTKAPVAVQLDAKENGGAFSLQIFYVGLPQGVALSDADLKKIATAAAQKYAEKSVEKTVTLEPLKSDTVDGYSATFTNAAPGRFACVTTVGVKLGDGLLAATISHPKDSENLATALDMIKAATLVTPSTQPAKARSAPAK